MDAPIILDLAKETTLAVSIDDDDNFSDPFLDGLLASWSSRDCKRATAIKDPISIVIPKKNDIIVYDISDDSDCEEEMPKKQAKKFVKETTLQVTNNSGASNPGSSKSSSNSGSSNSGANPRSSNSGSNPGSSNSGSNPGSSNSGSNPGSSNSGSNPGSSNSGANSGSSNSGAKKRSRQSIADYYYALFASQPTIARCVETTEEIELRKRMSEERQKVRKTELEQDRINAIKKNTALLKEKEIKRKLYYDRIGQQFNK